MPSKMPTASRDRFLDTLSCRAVDRPPVWLMRQAGRFLPEYRALRERSSFLELVRTPALAAEATLQPVRRFPGIDVAILFSDILVIAEALGQPYGVRDDGGIAMGYRIETLAQIAALASADSAADHLRYVGDTLMLVRSELAGAKALLGFGGSPWTLAAYMVEGGSSTDFKRIKLLYYTDRHTFDALLRKITEALIAYFQLQIAAGADAIQIFDSWGGVIAGPDYEIASLKWIRQVVAALPPGFPVILYAKGTASQVLAQAHSGVRALSVDWTCDLAALRRTLPATIALQGNLDPLLLQTTPETVVRETTQLLNSMRGTPGHILNLGHGVAPEATIECVQALVDTASAWS